MENKIIIPANFLSYTPVNIDDYCYGVMLDYGKNKLHYKIHCKYLGHIAGTHDYVMSFEREQVYINDFAPDRELYEIADTMSKAFYPIWIRFDIEQNILELENYDKIVERCNKTVEKLSRENAGKYAEKYIQNFKNQYGNPNTIINNLKNELFLRLYLLPINIRYNEKLQAKTQTHFLLNCIEQTWNLNINIEPYYTETNKIVINIESEEKQDDKPCLKAQYKTYHDDFSIFSINSCIFVPINNRLEEVNCEVYHLNESERDVKSRFVELPGDIKPKPEKKEGFWKNLF